MSFSLLDTAQTCELCLCFHLECNCEPKLALSNRADTSQAGHRRKDKVENTRKNHITTVEALQGSVKEVDKAKAEAFPLRQISNLM